jgi:hypothetical protein
MIMIVFLIICVLVTTCRRQIHRVLTPSSRRPLRVLPRMYSIYSELLPRALQNRVTLDTGLERL